MSVRQITPAVACVFRTFLGKHHMIVTRNKSHVIRLFQLLSSSFLLKDYSVLVVTDNKTIDTEKLCYFFRTGIYHITVLI